MTEEVRPHMVTRLASIMADIKRVAKRGLNDFHKYNYATEADIADAVRGGLAAAGIMMIPSVKEVAVEELPKKNGGKDRLVRLTVAFTVTDGKDGFTFDVVGEGTDAGDKASYKAMTGATKYALLKLFLIPTGDDPEMDSREDEEEKPVKRRGKQQQEAPPKDATAPKLRETFKRAKELGVVGDSDTFYVWARTILGEARPVPEWQLEDYAKLNNALAEYEKRTVPAGNEVRP